MLIDSHCHLTLMDLTPFDNKIANVLQDAACVSHFLSVCVQLSDVASLAAIATAYSQVSFSVGLHPLEVVAEEPDVLTLIKHTNHPSCIAIGETGLDYARITQDSEKLQQQLRFRAHIRAAKQTGLPLIVHTRAAQEDTIRILTEEGAQDVGGVMHCFTESWEMAWAALNLNFYISYSGIVTFQNATLVREVATLIPEDRLLIETDAPYLAPVPMRGKSNRPAWVKYTAESLATLRKTTFENIAHTTTQNFSQCFRIKL